MLEPVTEALGNTPAIARKSYVHPRLIELARDKDAQAAFRERLHLPRATRYLNRVRTRPDRLSRGRGRSGASQGSLSTA